MGWGVGGGSAVGNPRTGGAGVNIKEGERIRWSSQQMRVEECERGLDNRSRNYRAQGKRYSVALHGALERHLEKKMIKV